MYHFLVNLSSPFFKFYDFFVLTILERSMNDGLESSIFHLVFHLARFSIFRPRKKAESHTARPPSRTIFLSVPYTDNKRLAASPHTASPKISAGKSTLPCLEYPCLRQDYHHLPTGDNQETHERNGHSHDARILSESYIFCFCPQRGYFLRRSQPRRGIGTGGTTPRAHHSERRRQPL